METKAINVGPKLHADSELANLSPTEFLAGLERDGIKTDALQNAQAEVEKLLKSGAGNEGIYMTETLQSMCDEKVLARLLGKDGYLTMGRDNYLVAYAQNPVHFLKDLQERLERDTGVTFLSLAFGKVFGAEAKLATVHASDPIKHNG